MAVSVAVTLFFFSVPEHELKEESRNMEAKQETVGKGFLLTQYWPTDSGWVGTDGFSVARRAFARGYWEISVFLIWQLMIVKVAWECYDVVLHTPLYSHFCVWSVSRTVDKEVCLN